MSVLRKAELPEGSRPRIHPRARVAGQVMIHDEARLFIAPIGDISAGGVFVTSLVHLPIGSVVKLVLKAPALTGPVQVEGTVVRVDREQRRGSAVRFSLLADSARDAIQAIVFESRMEAALKAA